MPQILFDITQVHRQDIKTGIQRVVRNLLTYLLDHPPAGYRTEVVYSENGVFRYARRFTLRMLGLDEALLTDEVVQTSPGDRFIGMDLTTADVNRNVDIFQTMRNHGVEIYFGVYDLLPVLKPEYFPPHAEPDFALWLRTISRVSTGLICDSRTVADELVDWLTENAAPPPSPVRVDWIHLGADLERSSVTAAKLNDTLAESSTVPQFRDKHGLADSALAAMQAKPSFLMVGTVEPRKGHSQALSAMECLWQQGQDVNLVIIGKEGWMIGALARRLRRHPEAGKRLFWLEGASDALLEQCYLEASALLFNSAGEGFGLPLIEAAQRGLPIVARDLPVFQEIAQEHAFYLSGQTPEEIAQELATWLALYADDKAPSSEGLAWQTWADCGRQLVARLGSAEPYKWFPSAAQAEKH